MRIIFIGGQNAGIIGLLTILSLGHKVICAVGYDDNINYILNLFKIPQWSSIKYKSFISLMSETDILLCIHGREIIPKEYLLFPKWGCYNVHPYLYKYKGSDPIGRAIKDNNCKASVGMHEMTKEIDSGKVICEMFEDVVLSNHVYNQLYPLYVKTIIAGLKNLEIIIDQERNNW